MIRNVGKSARRKCGRGDEPGGQDEDIDPQIEIIAGLNVSMNPGTAVQAAVAVVTGLAEASPIDRYGSSRTYRAMVPVVAAVTRTDDPAWEALRRQNRDHRGGTGSDGNPGASKRLARHAVTRAGASGPSPPLLRPVRRSCDQRQQQELSARMG